MYKGWTYQQITALPKEIYELPENWVFCLGLVLIAGSAIIGAVTYCYLEQISPVRGEAVIVGRLETGARTFRIIEAEE